MRSLLEDVARGYDGFVELRYHNKVFRSLLVSQGRVERSTVRHRKGVGVRVLVNGTWGFASTSDCSASAIRAAVETASASAKASSSFRKAKAPASTCFPAVSLLGIVFTSLRHCSGLACLSADLCYSSNLLLGVSFTTVLLGAPCLDLLLFRCRLRSLTFSGVDDTSTERVGDLSSISDFDLSLSLPILSQGCHIGR